MKKALLILLTLTGCASIVDGRPDTINLISSNGASATANVTTKAGTQVVSLPGFVIAEKSCKDITIQVIEDKNVKTSTAIAGSSVNPWVFGNIIFGGLIGLGVDALTGSICTYDNNIVIPIIPKS